MAPGYARARPAVDVVGGVRGGRGTACPCSSPSLLRILSTKCPSRARARHARGRLGGRRVRGVRGDSSATDRRPRPSLVGGLYSAGHKMKSDIGRIFSGLWHQRNSNALMSCPAK